MGKDREDAPWASFREAVEIAKKRSTFSSGSERIDRLLEGGYRTGEVIQVFGASNSGKTQLAMQAALSATKAGSAAIFVDTEGSFRPERLASIAESRGVRSDVVLERVYCVRASNTKQQFEAVDLALEEEKVRSCRMVVIDTVTRHFALEYPGTKGTTRRQTALGAYLNAVARDAYLHDRAVILTNRVASVGQPPTAHEVDLGGDTLRRYITKGLHLRRAGDHVYATLITSHGEAGEGRASIGARGLE